MSYTRWIWIKGGVPVEPWDVTLPMVDADTRAAIERAASRSGHSVADWIYQAARERLSRDRSEP